MPDSIYPPIRFHKTDFVFRPPAKIDPSQFPADLFDETQRLVSATRYRSALNKMLQLLDAQPRNPMAYLLAGLILYESRTQQMRAAEPVNESQYFDTRLDPVFTQCSSCNRTWVVLDTILKFGQVAITNPRALQCYDCGYVMCRDCYEAQADTVGLVCKHCSSENLKARVYPTGRTARQLPRLEHPIAMMIVFREGPVPPSIEDVAEICRLNSPDALEDNATLGGIPLSPWPSENPHEMIEFARATIESEYRQSRLPVGRAESVVSYFVKDRLRHVVVKLPMDAEESAALREVMMMRVEQAIAESQDDPRLETTESLLRRCVTSPLLKFTMNMIAARRREAEAIDKPRYTIEPFDDLVIVVQAIPQLNPGVQREELGEQYSQYPLELLRQAGIDPGEKPIAYWVVHTDGSKLQLYFSFLPPTPDLLTIVGVGMSTGVDDSQEGGYLFCFDWQAISDAGHLRYGRYVHQQSLPHLAPQRRRSTERLILFDGDLYPDERLSLVMYSAEDQACFDQVRQVGIERCYALAIYGSPADLEALHQGLRAAGTLGYLGRISWRGDFEGFYKLTGSLALVPSAFIDESLFSKIDFAYLSDLDLIEMGFLAMDADL